MTELPTAVHSAFRGYAWSGIPEGLTEKLMDRLRELAAAKRGDFPDAEAVDRGVVAIGPIAAAFTIRRVPEWDSNGRASEYSALAFFKSADAADVNFGQLLRLPFFTTPSREIPRRTEYAGGAASAVPLTTAVQLLCHRHLGALPADQGGDLLAKYFTKSNQWIFRAQDDGTLSVDCAEWKKKTEN